MVLLAMAAAAALVLLLSFGSRLTFFGDDWSFLLYRRGLNAQAFFLPHNGHIVVIPVAVYEAVRAVFGMGSATPYRVVETLLVVGTALLVFAYVRRRVGDWPALLASALLLFLGPAWQTLLWPFGMVLGGSLAAGIAMLGVLDRRTLRADALACVLLTIATLCSNLGLAFIAAAAADVAADRRDWRPRIWIPALPLALYAIWYARYGHASPSHLSGHNLVHLPGYIVAGLGASIQSLVGLVPADYLPGWDPTWGRIILAGLAIAFGIRLLRGHRPSRRLWPAATAVAAFWILTGANFYAGREATSSRYQFIGAALILLLVAELFRGVRIRAWVVAAMASITIAALVVNVDRLQSGGDYMRQQSNLTRADLGALDIAQRTVDPFFSLTPRIAGTPNLTPVSAYAYFPAARAYGSPADTPDRLASSRDPYRAQADVVLANALPLGLATTRGAARDSACAHRAKVGGGHGRTVTLRSGVTIVRAAAGPPVELRLRRFATGLFPYDAGSVRGGTTAKLTVPPDRVARRWHLRVGGSQAVTLCSSPA